MKATRELEDASTQAGWMFADLFLALTVIFLATVSFVPSGKYSANSESSNAAMLSASQMQINKQIALISNGFIGEYKSDSSYKFVQDLEKYMKMKEIPLTSTAIYLEAIGHTKAYGLANDSGNLEALKFVISLKKAKPINLEGTNTSINLSPEVNPGWVRVKITFA